MGQQRILRKDVRRFQVNHYLNQARLYEAISDCKKTSELNVTKSNHFQTDIDLLFA